MKWVVQLLVPILTLLTSLGVIILGSRAAIALDQETLLLLTDPLTYPLDLPLLQPGAAPRDGSVITADTISQSGLTAPSLWWTQDQFGNKLLENWLAYPGTNGTPRRVDLVVNQQLWSLYTYLEKYRFLNQFGTTAWDFGYNTRVFSRDQELLAAYVCESPGDGAIAPDGSGTPADLPTCSVFLNSTGTGSLRGRSNLLGASQSTNGGTGL